MTKKQNKFDSDSWDNDEDDYAVSFSDRIKDKREKMLRATELRRKIEDRLESRKLMGDYGDIDSYMF